MCDQATQTILDKIISNWVSEQKMFTALSVSREAQRNYGVTLRHNEMKNETHRVYASGTMGSHERMLVTLPGINGQAWAYFPQGINPENYDLIPLLNGPIDCKDTKIDPPAPNMQVSIPDPFAGIKVSRQKSSSLMSSITPRTVSGYQVDKRKRLWVPRQYVKALGAKTGDWLSIEIDTKSLKIMPKLNSRHAVTSYKVDSKGNIAISRFIFADAGLTASSYDFLDMNGTVVVTEA